MQSRPNILFLLTDQQRFDALGVVSPWVKTPNLDRLARGGTVFKESYCNSPLCMPSRQSLFSGRYPSVTGTLANGVEMPEDLPHLSSFLKPYGYRTGYCGKLHFKNHSNRDHREPHPSYGFDLLVNSDEPGCYPDAYIEWVKNVSPGEVDNCRCTSPPICDFHPRIDVGPREPSDAHVFEGPEQLTHSAFVAQHCIDFLNTHSGGPFFLTAGFYAPHAPINPPARFLEWYSPENMPLPSQDQEFDSFIHDENLDLEPDRWQRNRQYYYALVSHVDDQIGRILSALERRNLAENTLIIFTSDHGENLGDHQRIGKGMPAWRSSSAVPLIISPPRSSGAEISFHNSFVELVDIVPTALEYAGVPVPPSVQGRSLKSLLSGEKKAFRDSVFIEQAQNGGLWRAVRNYEWTYLYFTDGKKVWEGLYDLSSDPGESTNLANEEGHESILSDLRGLMLRRITEAVQGTRPTGAY